MKLCPKCGSTDVIMFTADDDICQKCRAWFPAIADIECHKKCKTYGEKELRHHKDCFYYPKSFSKMHDDEKLKNKQVRKDIKRIIFEINEQILQDPTKPNVGKKSCITKLVQLLDGKFESTPNE